MTTAVVKMRVGSYDDWKPVFDQARELRNKHGGRAHRVLQGVEDPNEITVVTEWPSREAARAFLSDPELREAMQRAGVSGQPEFWVGDETESVQY